MRGPSVFRTPVSDSITTTGHRHSAAVKSTAPPRGSARRKRGRRNAKSPEDNLLHFCRPFPVNHDLFFPWSSWIFYRTPFVRLQPAEVEQSTLGTRSSHTLPQLHPHTPLNTRGFVVDLFEGGLDPSRRHSDRSPSSPDNKPLLKLIEW